RRGRQEPARDRTRHRRLHRPAHHRGQRRLTPPWPAPGWGRPLTHRTGGHPGMGSKEPKSRKPKGQAGQGTVYWDEKKRCYRGEISLGYTPSGKRRRPKVYGRTKAEVREKMQDLAKAAKSGVKPSASYTV